MYCDRKFVIQLHFLNDNSEKNFIHGMLFFIQGDPKVFSNRKTLAGHNR